MFACLFLPLVPASSAARRSPAAAEALAAVAREFSPRVETRGDSLVVIDIRGLDRLLGDAWAIGRELRRAAADRGLAAHVAVAATRSAAMLLACGRSGLTVARPGEEQRLLADLPLTVLGVLAGEGISGGLPYALRPTPCAFLPSTVLRRWGLRTLGELAALPPAALSERLGQDGVWWQHLARGEDAGPLVPDLPEKRYEASLDLEWPVESLEPLAFVFARLFEPLCAELAHDDRAAAVLHVAFTLVTREIDTRTLQLPAPMRHPRVLRTLVLLNLEGHPVAAGIDRIVVTADPAPGRISQGSLLGRTLPVPEQLAPLIARLGALMGEARVGAAALVDSHRPEAFRMTPFSIQSSSQFPVSSSQDVTRDTLRTENCEPILATGAGRRPRASRPLSTAECQASGSCPGDGHLPLRLGMPLDPVARLDARATARDRFASGLAVDSRLLPSTSSGSPEPVEGLSDQPQRQTTATRPPARGRDTRDLLTPDTHYQVPSTKYQVLRPCSSSLSTTAGFITGVGRVFRPANAGLKARATGYETGSTHYPLPTVVRRFRIPVPARVRVEGGAPVHIRTDRAGLAGGRVERAAGPWRTSGEWWQLSDARLQPRADGRPVQVGWNRDEWDVALDDGGIYRIYRDRCCGRWFVDGIVD